MKKQKIGTSKKKKRNGMGNYSDWENNQEEWKETESERSDGRGRNSKENIVERGKLRVAGFKKNEVREESEKRRRGDNRYTTPRKDYWTGGKKK